MAKKKEETEKHHILPLSTEIEVICIKNEQVTKSTKTFEEALTMQKESGCKYLFYQKGFSSFTETK